MKIGKKKIKSSTAGRFSRRLVAAAFVATLLLAGVLTGLSMQTGSEPVTNIDDTTFTRSPQIVKPVRRDYVTSVPAGGNAVTPTPTPCPGCNIIVDGGFEGTSPSTPPVNANWPSTSTNFGTSLCNVASCGNNTIPRNGTYVAWFGGTSAAEAGSVQQTLVIPAGSNPVLNYWLRIAGVTAPFDASLVVKVDGTVIQTITEPAVAEGAYTQRTIALPGATANGTAHVVRFEYTNPAGSGSSSFFVDDVTLSSLPAGTPTPTPPAVTFEGDINRVAVGVPSYGDQDVNIGDQIQYQRFLSGTDCPTLVPNEQQRLDAGPRFVNNVPAFGDGLLGGTDGAAIDAYARHDMLVDFDPNTAGWQPTPAGGQTAITNLGCTPVSAPESDMATATIPEPEAAAAARIVRVVSRQAGNRNGDITVDIEMAAQGNEAGTQYSLHFDPAVLAISDISGVNTNPDITLGDGAPATTTLNVNASDAANGRLGIGENFNGAAATSITAVPAGTTRITRVRFHVLDTAATGQTRITFDDTVISGMTADVNGLTLGTSYDQTGSVSVTASRGVTVSGRVTSPDGRGLRNATVTIVNQNGFARTVTTSSFGYYTFDDVAAATYTIGVSSRQYRFASRTIETTDNLTDVDFTGSE